MHFIKLLRTEQKKKQNSVGGIQLKSIKNILYLYPIASKFKFLQQISCFQSLKGLE